MKINSVISRNFSVFKASYVSLWQVRALSWAIVVLVLSIGVFATVFQNQKVTFAFSKQQCVGGLILFPSSQSVKATTKSKVTYEKAVAVAGVPVFARGACYDFQAAPIENEKVVISHSLFGLGFLTKNHIFAVSDYPQLVSNQIPATISTAKPLQFSLSAPDNFFNYALNTDKATAPCEAQGETINCEVKELGLEHSKTYQLALTQSFNNTEVGTVATIRAVTANPVVLTSESIATGATIYDKPTQIIITADRPIQSSDIVSLTSKVGSEPAKPIASQGKIDGKKIIVTWQGELPRQAEIQLTISNANAADGGTLVSPFVATYKTSGGPKVTGVNVRDRAVPLGQSLVLTLDQELKSGQNLTTLFGIKVGGAVIPATVTAKGKTVTIAPSSPIAMCTAFQLWAADGSLSPSGVSGGSVWSYNSRTTCATVFSIGSSVKGRSITAYKFGSGSNTILFNGNLHGNESNTKRLLDAWINELQGNPGRIPAGKSIVVIPLSNPDGYAAGSRTNAHNVDLNRNFAANNWKSSVKMPSGQTLPTGGGTSAHSEPETQALVNYVNSLGPRLVMSYHSMGNVAVANDSGSSWNLTKSYSGKSGYSAQNGSTIGNFFDYDTTGAFEDWLHDKKGIAAILIELATRESDEFGRNKNAMWQMVSDY